MRFLLDLYGELSSGIRFGVAGALFAGTLAMQFVWGIFWPFGYVLAAVFAVLGIMSEGGD